MNVSGTPLERLQELLRDLLQLDLSDLDFGIYRLLSLKRDEVEAFLYTQLPEAVNQAFAAIGAAEREDLERRVSELADRLRAEVADDALLPDGAVANEYRNVNAKAIRELIAEYDEARARHDVARSTDAQRVEVFNHLYGFFQRYYENGDFIPRRRYGAREQYAVPYNGEETLLHWANQGQHYVKSAEVFRDYAFTVEGDLLEDACRVRFVLTEATVSPGDTKGDARYFFPQPAAVEWDPDERTLRLPFAYRRLTGDEAQRFGRTGIQDSILAEALDDLRGALPNGAVAAALLPARSDDEHSTDADPPLLVRHLRRFVRRQTSDYFVHRDLRAFLERELEFYIKDQVVHLGDLDGDLVVKRRMLRVLRDVAGQLITFLSQLEDVQKRLFEKRKFVLSTEYLVLMRAVPREMWQEILANEGQLAEWNRLFHVEPQQDLFNPDGEVDESFLEQRPTLVVNTALFDADFRDRLLASFDDIDGATGGILVHSENYQALRLLEPRFRGQVKCIYIDPPYNTGSDDFLYKDRYQHSSWLSMMDERLELGRRFLSDDGVAFVSIDENEQHQLHQLLRQQFGSRNYLGDIVWKNANDNNPTRIAIEHEQVLAYARRADRVPSEWKSDYSTAKSLLLDKYEELAQTGASIVELQAEYGRFLRTNRAMLGKLTRYKHVDENGPYTGSESVHNPHPGGYDYEIVHPATGRPMRKPANGYRFPEETLRKEYLERGRLLYGPDENRIVKIKLYLREYREALRSVVEIDSRLGAYALRDLFGPQRRVFTNPKAVELIAHLVSFASGPGDLVVDFMAGSGTTAQALVDLGRRVGGTRRFLLIEHAGHFDEVLLPRVQKCVFSTKWTKGMPSLDADLTSDGDLFPLYKILRLESYEDALHNLTTEAVLDRQSNRADAIRNACGDDEYRLRYLATLPLEASSTMLDVRELAHPFDYQLEVLTEEGPEVRKVDLIETFNLVYGLRVRTMQRWVNEADNGRTYRVVTGTDAEGHSTLVIWRDMGDLDPKADRDFIEESMAGLQGAPFETILVNGDSAVPRATSLDPVFKQRMSEGET